MKVNKNLSNHLTRKNIIIGVIIVIGFFVINFYFKCFVTHICGNTLIEQSIRPETIINTPTGLINVEVADTKEAREQGLSGRKSINDVDGMLFVFPNSGVFTFWMKDMIFSIDMVWINEQGIVVHIERNVSPDSYFKKNPPEIFSNTAPAKYVLEVKSENAEKFGLYLGTKVDIGTIK